MEDLKDIQNSEGLILVIDIDDCVSFSSGPLQKVIDEKTNFKSPVLKMLEQLKRNCKYYAESVESECNSAKEEKRNPNFTIYKLFNGMEFSDEEKYTKPIDIAKEYAKAAELIYDQFLEERDTFLEIDNLPKGSIIAYNYIKEALGIIKFAELVHNTQAGFHIINEFCYEIVRIKSNIAYKNRAIPDYESLVSMDSNDIIKSGKEEDKAGSIEKYLYEKPVERVKQCLDLEDHIGDIITNARVFFTPSEEIVDYSKIHCIENVNMKAVAFIRKLIATGLFDASYFGSHNTGPREDGVKGPFYITLIPEVDGYCGKRFHTEEHDANKRGRSSKIDEIAERLGVDRSRIVLLDDSIANCRDCLEKGGIPILYKPMTDSEKINGELVDTGFKRILSFDDPNVINEIVEICLNHIAKCKKLK